MSAAPVMRTVCPGSALLARTGRLDGRPATSNKIAEDSTDDPYV
jgi:putative intracellular protease/amidase